MKVSNRLILLTATLFLATLFPARPIHAVGTKSLPTLPLKFDPDTLANPGRPGGRRRGGGSRGGECAAADPALTAIVYARRVSELGIEVEETVGTLTTQAQPKLWFYLPSPLTEGTQVSLTLKDNSNRLLYEGPLSGAADRAGIVGVTLPVDLAVGQAYHWFLTMDCADPSEADPSEADLAIDASDSSVTVDGWIERRAIAPDLLRTFAQAEARNRAALYANEGFLADALSELAALRLGNPEDEAISQDWVRFLHNLDLSDLTNAPLLECCQTVESQSMSLTP
jgi:hypothetical protein